MSEHAAPPKKVHRLHTIRDWVSQFGVLIAVLLLVVLGIIQINGKQDAQDKTEQLQDTTLNLAELVKKACAEGGATAKNLGAACGQANAVISEPQVIKGERGLTGSPGPPGPQGIDGKPGPRGPAGPPGKNGKDGAKGEPGSNGADGAAGANGADGATGSSGPPGPQGEPGPAGPPGADGRDGRTPTQGTCTADPAAPGQFICTFDQPAPPPG